MNSETARSTVWAHTLGRMERAMKASGTVIRSKVLESLNGQMVGDSKVVGSVTNFTVVVFILGQTEEVTMVNILKTKSMGSESINGQMARSMKDIGKTVNNTDRVNLRTNKANQG